jgi:phospholipid/cholesterol/gamma-HCH transport system substrate-binding protein
MAALVVGVATLAVVLFGGGRPYVVHARFISASQMVKGGEVKIAGERVGTVDKVALTDDWHADLTLKVDADHAPLRRGTVASIRQVSLSGVANRYVDLQMPSGTEQQTIPDGGVIDERATNSAVDVDQLFNLLRPKQRRGLQRVVRGFGRSIDGRSRQAAAGFRYLDPNLSTNARLFDELTRDRPALEHFIIDSSRLATHVAERRDDLAGLVDQLADFTGALARQRTALGSAIDVLPTFLRRADTTFVNLRATLDDLDPVLDDSRPVARRLGPLLDQLRPFARAARPTVRDLARTITRKGANNDLLELTRSNVPAANILVRAAERNGRRREGALPASARAFEGQTPATADLRPYTPDLLGWFDDFGHTGILDANGGAARASAMANAFANVNGTLTPIPPELREPVLKQVASLHQNDRCPGSGEHRGADGSNPWKPTPDFNCDPSHTLPGD